LARFTIRATSGSPPAAGVFSRDRHVLSGCHTVDRSVRSGHSFHATTGSGANSFRQLRTALGQSRRPWPHMSAWHSGADLALPALIDRERLPRDVAVLPAWRLQRRARVAVHGAAGEAKHRDRLIIRAPCPQRPRASPARRGRRAVEWPLHSTRHGRCRRRRPGFS
jgi:hypothetical protein